jgi:uncharacterized HAD superfamily protein
MTKPNLCVDLDGTICTEDNDMYTDRTPMPGVIKSLKKLQKKYRIIIFTGRHYNHCYITKKWLEKYKIPYDDIVFGKPPAVAYIDNLGKEFKSWEKIEKEFLG